MEWYLMALYKIGALNEYEKNKKLDNLLIDEIKNKAGVMFRRTGS